MKNEGVLWYSYKNWIKYKALCSTFPSERTL